ncbi:MAG: DnaJ domain-containing protein [Bacteroidia bacterium]|nr:DnaJ domain-containing protein [Bacteroidia bacterium]
MSFKNYYIILGVKNTATAKEIKAAYRALAKKYHPDKNHGDKFLEEKFKEIQEAYAVLSNVVQRKKYDLKFSYGSATSPSSYQKPYTAYTGKAYQYAQQEAHYRKKYSQAEQSKPASTTKTEKEEFKERYQLLVSIGIALLLLYMVVTYSSHKKERSTVPLKKEKQF